MSSRAVCALVFAGVLSSAHGTVLTTEISMDNGFAVYVSTSDTTAGTLFGSANDWYHAYTHTTTLAAGVDYYLHVYAYDQGGIAGFLGEFTLSGSSHLFANGSTSLLTNTTYWKGNNTGFSNAYGGVVSLGTHGVGPWGNITGIPATATWIWAGDANNNNVAYFSTKITAQQVPDALNGGVALLLVLAGIVTFRRRAA